MSRSILVMPIDDVDDVDDVLDAVLERRRDEPIDNALDTCDMLSWVARLGVVGGVSIAWLLPPPFR